MGFSSRDIITLVVLVLVAVALIPTAWAQSLNGTCSASCMTTPPTLTVSSVTLKTSGSCFDLSASLTFFSSFFGAETLQACVGTRLVDSPSVAQLQQDLCDVVPLATYSILSRFLFMASTVITFPIGNFVGSNVTLYALGQNCAGVSEVGVFPVLVQSDASPPPAIENVTITTTASCTQSSITVDWSNNPAVLEQSDFYLVCLSTPQAECGTPPNVDILPETLPLVANGSLAPWQLLNSNLAFIRYVREFNSRLLLSIVPVNCAGSGPITSRVVVVPAPIALETPIESANCTPILLAFDSGACNRTITECHWQPHTDEFGQADVPGYVAYEFCVDSSASASASGSCSVVNWTIVPDLSTTAQQLFGLELGMPLFFKVRGISCLPGSPRSEPVVTPILESTCQSAPSIPAGWASALRIRTVSPFDQVFTEDVGCQPVVLFESFPTDGSPVPVPPLGTEGQYCVGTSVGVCDLQPYRQFIWSRFLQFGMFVLRIDPLTGMYPVHETYFLNVRFRNCIGVSSLFSQSFLTAAPDEMLPAMTAPILPIFPSPLQLSFVSGQCNQLNVTFLVVLDFLALQREVFLSSYEFCLSSTPALSCDIQSFRPFYNIQVVLEQNPRVPRTFAVSTDIAELPEQVLNARGTIFVTARATGCLGLTSTITANITIPASNPNITSGSIVANVITVYGNLTDQCRSLIAEVDLCGIPAEVQVLEYCLGSSIGSCDIASGLSTVVPPDLTGPLRVAIGEIPAVNRQIFVTLSGIGCFQEASRPISIPLQIPGNLVAPAEPPVMLNWIPSFSLTSICNSNNTITIQVLGATSPTGTFSVAKGNALLQFCVSSSRSQPTPCCDIVDWTLIDQISPSGMFELPMRFSPGVYFVSTRLVTCSGFAPPLTVRADIIPSLPVAQPFISAEIDPQSCSLRAIGGCGSIGVDSYRYCVMSGADSFTSSACSNRNTWITVQDNSPVDLTDKIPLNQIVSLVCEAFNCAGSSGVASTSWSVESPQPPALYLKPTPDRPFEAFVESSTQELGDAANCPVPVFTWPLPDEPHSQPNFQQSDLMSEFDGVVYEMCISSAPPTSGVPFRCDVVRNVTIDENRFELRNVSAAQDLWARVIARSCFGSSDPIFSRLPARQPLQRIGISDISRPVTISAALRLALVAFAPDQETAFQCFAASVSQLQCAFLSSSSVLARTPATFIDSRTVECSIPAVSTSNATVSLEFHQFGVNSQSENTIAL